MLLKYIENDTKEKCKNDIEFIKESINNLEDSGKTDILRFLFNSNLTNQLINSNQCDCYSDENCSECDN